MSTPPAAATPPAYRIETERLLLRCWSPDDAVESCEAIWESLDHLRPWMGWARDAPQTLESRLEELRRFRAMFDLGQDFHYAIFDGDEERCLGACGLHPRAGKGALAIGYWIRSSAVGQGLATEAAAALTRVGFEVEKVDRLEIRCEITNGASARVAEKLGYQREATLRRRVHGPDGLRDEDLWCLFREEYPTAPAARVSVRALDALGRRLI